MYDLALQSYHIRVRNLVVVLTMMSMTQIYISTPPRSF